MANLQLEIKKEISNRIAKALTHGNVPWRRPWNLDPNCGLPRNVASNRFYHGINPLLLMISSIDHGFSSQWWGTFKQWQERGGTVKKRPKDIASGEWGTKVVFFQPWEINETDPKTGETKTKKIPILRTFTVFNVEQVEGEKLDKYRAGYNSGACLVEDWEPVDKLIRATKAEIHWGGNKAYYANPEPKDTWPNHKVGDYIQMPMRTQFIGQNATADFYSVMLHELVHWAEVRRGWKGTYAEAELIAELASTYVCSVLNVPESDDMENHNAYLKTWLKYIKDDPKWIFNIATEASNAADYLLQFIGKSIKD